MTCPLLYRLRVIDRVPERPSPAAVRGTVVHAVLEELFDLPRGGRTPNGAAALLPKVWERLRAEHPEWAELFGDDADGAVLAEWLADAKGLLERYFGLEDPNRLEPAERELYVEVPLEVDGERVLLRGYVDRLDVAPDGALRVVDYKTGRAPGAAFEAKAMFQMNFYALVLWKVRGIVPKRLQLMYLGSGDVLRYDPDEATLRATERKLVALWMAIRTAAQSGNWPANPSRLCAWCDHKPRCPAHNGTPPPLPDVTVIPA
jgi:putative RecB family exonuclease